MNNRGEPLLEILSDWQECSEDHMGDGDERLENATLGYFVMRHGELCLTRGEHTFEDNKEFRKTDGPLVSAYYPAEWMAANYWRLCNEPALPYGFPGIRSRVDPDVESDWWATHHMSGIGNGYAWPRILVVSDGRDVVLNSARTSDKRSAFQYSFDGGLAVPQKEFEQAVQRFVRETIDQLDGAESRRSDLHDTWNEVAKEIGNPDLALYRRVEAMLGFDPEEGDEAQIRGLIGDAGMADEVSVAELANHNRTHGLLPGNNGRRESIRGLLAAADRFGIDSSPGDSVAQQGSRLPLESARRPAWQTGKELARAVRRRAGLNGGPVSSARLAEMAGVSPDAITRRTDPGVSLSFSAVNDNGNSEKVVLRPAGDRGMRFAVARIIGNRVLEAAGTRLHLAADSATYRQKAQRAFAAELLCPASEMKERLGSDPSTEEVEKAARSYLVSTEVIRNHIANSNRRGILRYAV